MGTIDSQSIEYLAFEGGGGKGVVYLGAIRALETKMWKYGVAAVTQTKDQGQIQGEFKYDFSPPIAGIPPLFPIWASHPQNRKLKGISGSSAGAITAFFLAMGLNSAEIDSEMNLFKRGILAGHEVKMTEFEYFFSNPEPFKWRRHHPESNVRDKKGTSPLELFLNSKLANGHQYLMGVLPIWPTILSPVAYTEFRLLFRGLVGLTSSVIQNNVEAKLDRFCASAFYNDFLIKKLLLTDAIWDYEKAGRNRLSELEFWQEDKARQIPQDKLPSCFRFPNHANLKSYIHSLVVDRGLFSGTSVRQYFAEKLKKFIIDRAISKKNGHLLRTKDPQQFTFKDFYNITGVDFVVMGVNIVQGVPVSFSVTTTPDFPVVDAVGASMSIPFLFKPFAIEDRVNKSVDENAFENLMYYGLIVDGGMLNNYPIHAFNNVRDAMVRYGNQDQQRRIRFLSTHVALNPKVAGFRLQSNLKTAGLQSEIDPREIFLAYQKRPEIMQITDPMPYEIPFGSYIGSLYNSTTFPSELGQFDHPDVGKRTILINTADLSLTDFSAPAVDFFRGRTKLYEKKMDLINKANEVTGKVLK
jgi:predicted acylesterase/phospholipase RssA